MKIFVLSYFEWPFYTCFTVLLTRSEMSGPVTYIITIVHLGPLKYANDKKITHTHTKKKHQKKKKKKQCQDSAGYTHVLMWL